MAIFQKTVLANYLKQQDYSVIEKAFSKYVKYFHNATRQENIRDSKEEQYQEGFLRELFVNILGYTLNPEPDFNLTTELKNEKNAKKTDGAIIKDGQALAVIELKSTKTKDLESIRQQAFDYKANQSGCVYVITSNFEKVRFYINDAVEFEEFNLFILNKDQFALMYLCLQKDNLLNNIPLRIKTESVVKEAEITKNFYSDYSIFKRELYRDLIKENMKNEVFRNELQKDDKDKANKNIKLTLYKTSQKLIDRFLFIFFAEDRGLLPANSTLQILQDWKKLKDLDEVVPLYKRFKLYFKYLDEGRKGTDQKAEIFAYNGGLFQPDAILDSLVIDDNLLYKHTKALSDYDFNSQVDVNILGHIFENSLNDIESVNAEIEGTYFDKQKTKRKKDGVFYTPKYITKYIVDNTIGKLCNDKKAELKIIEEDFNPKRQKDAKKKLLATLETYREWLLQLTICDPACGSGAFLNQALDFLIKEHTFIDELQTTLLGGGFVMPNIENTILEKNIYGVDLNEESIEIAKLSLWLRTAQPRRKLNVLSGNIKCGNSLIDNRLIAGDKSFNWKHEFPDVFAKGGFDVVIGNPPYVRAELLSPFRDYFQSNYKVFNPSGDLFSYFYEKSFNLLKSETGLFGFISNTFDKTTAGISVRDYLKREISFLKYVDFTEVKIFEGATTYPVIITAQNKKNADNTFAYIKIPKSSQAPVIDIGTQTEVQVEQNTLDKENWSFKSNLGVDLIDKLKKHKNIREIYGKSNRGIVTGYNEAFIVNLNFKENVKLQNIKEAEIIKPLLEGKDLAKWNIPQNDKHIIFSRRGINIEDYQIIKSHFEKFKSGLTPRTSIEQTSGRKPGSYKWYEIQDSVDYYRNFEKPKIVFPNLQNSNKFSYDVTGTYINAPAVILPTDDRFLIAILNSKLVWYFLTNICVVRSGGYIEVKPQYFEQIPIPNITDAIKNVLDELTAKIIEYTSETQRLGNKFIKLLTSKFAEISITNKLEKWFNLSFAELQKELNKQKIKLSLSDEADWLEFFEHQKKSYLEVVNTIKLHETKINQLVYELYNLTKEEIEIIENA